MGEIFRWITGFKITKNEQATKVVNLNKNKTKTVEQNPDANDVLKSLTGLGYGKQEAQEAMKYAIEEKPDANLEDKVKCALLYLGSDSVLKGIA
jgi:Holliday junction resolvasome RuvABC DNA-binding subunit